MLGRQGVDDRRSLISRVLSHLVKVQVLRTGGRRGSEMSYCQVRQRSRAAIKRMGGDPAEKAKDVPRDAAQQTDNMMSKRRE